MTESKRKLEEDYLNHKRAKVGMSQSDEELNFSNDIEENKGKSFWLVKFMI